MRILSIIDEYSRECLLLKPARNFPVLPWEALWKVSRDEALLLLFRPDDVLFRVDRPHLVAVFFGARGFLRLHENLLGSQLKRFLHLGGGLRNAVAEVLHRYGARPMPSQIAW